MSRRSVQDPSPGNGTMPTELAAAFRVVQAGTKLRRVKHKSVGSPNSVTLSSDHSQLKYHSRHSWKFMANVTKILKISEILEVRVGWNTDNFHRASKKISFQDMAKEHLCFSVLFRHPILFQKSVDLVAETEDEAKAWTMALRHLVAENRKQILHFNEDKWLSQNFKEADRNKSGTLSFEELWRLLKDLNLELDEGYGRRLFEKSDVRKKKTNAGEDGLDEEEFVRFFRILTQRRELETIMKLWSAANMDCLQPEDLCQFMKESQGFEAMTVDDAKDLIKQYEPEAVNKKDLLLSPNGFRLLLLSEWGSLCHRKYCRTVYMDMNQPMTDYFINSSHNTYLIGGQLRGEASVEGYINALKKGARLLEYVWDGDEEPILTHGHTLVEPIRLVDACKAINNHAFKYSSFPLILSIENHCSVEQQKIMADIFKASFGSSLLNRRFKNEPVMPSPNELRNKIMVKAKRLPDEVEDRPDGAGGGGGDGEGEDDEDVISEDDEEIATETTDGEVVSKEPERRVHKLAKEFSHVVSLTGTKLKDIDHDLIAHPVDSFVSVGENRMLGYVSEDPDKMRKYAAKHFVKSYPKGTRTSSTNMDPIPQWIAGVQIVTMNMQTAGDEMDMNEGFFKQNGGCGYVLRPKELRRNGNFDMTEIKSRPDTVLKFRVISGQYLPKPETTSEDDIIDPYVTVEVIGLDFDSFTRKTSVQRNNGLNPVWNDDFEFPLKAPELALLRVVVNDYDKTSYNDFIGQYTVPVSIMRKGYSHLHLSTGYARTVDPSATLFVHTEITETGY